MVNVNVNFNGRDYLLACEEGQEEDLQKLTEELSKKFNQLKKDLCGCETDFAKSKSKHKELDKNECILTAENKFSYLNKIRTNTIVFDLPCKNIIYVTAPK